MKFKVGDILCLNPRIKSFEDFKSIQIELGRPPVSGEFDLDYYQKFHLIKKVKVKYIHFMKDPVFKKSNLIIDIKILEAHPSLNRYEIESLEGHYYAIEFFSNLKEKIEKILKI